MVFLLAPFDFVPKVIFFESDFDTRLWKRKAKCKVIKKSVSIFKFFVVAVFSSERNFCVSLFLYLLFLAVIVFKSYEIIAYINADVTSVVADTYLDT